jgi:hypothetical protein
MKLVSCREAFESQVSSLQHPLLSSLSHFSFLTAEINDTIVSAWNSSS